LNVLGFTSTRKRMSVIVRLPNGRIRLITKGAVSLYKTFVLTTIEKVLMNVRKY